MMLQYEEAPTIARVRQAPQPAGCACCATASSRARCRRMRYFQRYLDLQAAFDRPCSP